MILGIFAGVGSGKSLVLDLLLKKGFKVLEADKVAHILYECDKNLLIDLKNKFGDKILDENKKLKKQELAEIIFKDKEAKKYIDDLLHPLVWAYIKNFIEKAKISKIDLAIEAAIMPLVDAKIYDYKIFIDTNDKLRKERLKESRSYSDEKIENIIKSQAEKEEFKNFCDFIIYNNSSKKELEKELELVLEKIKNENV